MRLRIKDLREDSGLTQKQIAGILHVSQATYSDYESGKIHIPLEALCKLADFYHTTVDYLLGRTDDPAPPK